MRSIRGSLLILFTLSSCAILNTSSYKIVDYKAFMGEGQSQRLNTIDRYCLVYDNVQVLGNIRDFDPILLEQQITAELENLGMNIRREELITKAITHEEKKQRGETILAREKRNNYKNCNILISYNFTAEENGRGCLFIDMYELEWYRRVGVYKICKSIFRREKQTEFLKRMIQKLWKYQEKTMQNPPKTVSYECSGYGCKTIECVGDTCITTPNSPYKQ